MRTIGFVSLAACVGVACGTKATVTRPFVVMPDGVHLAMDVVLPPVIPEGGVPTVLIQTRYWRSFALRGGSPSDRVPQGPREAIVPRLIEAGFGVVVVDVRGTGASEGVWAHPWSQAEIGDIAPMVDWVIAQPWSNGAVGATGVSYEGTNALLSASVGHPAVRAVLARQIEWDLVAETVAPGGVGHVGFVSAWSESVDALDRGLYPPMFPRGVKWAVDGVQPVDEDADGALLARVIADRTVADVAAQVSGVRGPEDAWGLGGPPAREVGPTGNLEGLAQTTAALGLWGSWWDGGTADAVLRGQAGMPVTEAVIGGWNHEGDAIASPLRRRGSEAPEVELDAVVGFFQRHLMGAAGAAPRAKWYVAGVERWSEADTWPVTTERTWHLVDEALVDAAAAGPTRSLNVDFSASTGPSSRWTTGLAGPVDAPNRAKAAGLLSWTGAPLPAAFAGFGAARFECGLEIDAPEAALHIYLEAVDPRGRVRLLTEGVQRVGSGEVAVRLLPVAFQLEPGFRLRLSVAGADAPAFERVPAAGPVRLDLSGEGCRVILPEAALLPAVP